MYSKVLFRDIKRTEELEHYLQVHTEEMIQHFFTEEESPFLKVTVYEDRHRQHGNSHFTCEILLTLRDHHRCLKVAKSGFDFYQCVAEAGVALRKQIRRHHRYGLNQRRVQQNLVHGLDLI